VERGATCAGNWRRRCQSEARAGDEGRRPGRILSDRLFSGAPGAFEIDVQVSDVDVDTQYQTCANGNITTVDATNQTFHFDGSTVLATFVRLLLRSRTNAVNVTADIHRL
jgi:hypothetical protein